MPPASQHRAWAIHNVQFYRSVRKLSGTWRDWLLTILFYVAVHDVMALLASRRSEFPGNLPKTHYEIKQAMRSRPKWKPLAALYDYLYTRSRRTRYGCWQPSEGDLQQARVVLRQLRREIKSL
jgi:hypothetical protein